MVGTMSMKRLQPKSQIGTKNTQNCFTIHDRAFSVNDAPTEKASQVRESLQLLHESKKPAWNKSTYNEASSKDYKRCNMLAERGRTNLFVYNYRAEKLPRAYPVAMPKANRFNVGLLHLKYKDEIPGECFSDHRVARGIGKCVEELPNHPNLSAKAAWNASVQVPRGQERRRERG
uniref:Uncharacterized protein AlNc14C218G9063 n=1 Tax=Albugo laibachii Nc14 TaxID=890382 RepID=F0WRR7_9STRA|nr:conserved hypothetical protein [Albugo laibachii Nc14]|eukprot:CCA24032.1 conserved hypothetical protein [Albugo laibachii Nc14]